MLRPILLSVVPLVPASHAQVATPQQALEQELTRLSDEWMRAVWDKDDAVLNRLMADDFVLVSPAGVSKVQNRPDWLSNTRMAGNGECWYSNVRVQSVGEVAVLSAELSCKGDYHGIGMESSSVVSDLWIRRDGKWRITTRIASTSPRFAGIWMPLLLGAAAPLAAWLWVLVRMRSRERNSLISSANRL